MHEQDRDELVKAVAFVGTELHELHKAFTAAAVALVNNNNILLKLDRLEINIMTLKEAFSKFVVDQTAFNQRQATAIDSIVASEAGLTGDVAELNRIITELQNSAGEVTPEDQALIDQLVAASEAATAKAEAVAAALKALDEQTPPAVPPVPQA